MPFQRAIAPFLFLVNGRSADSCLMATFYRRLNYIKQDPQESDHHWLTQDFSRGLRGGLGEIRDQLMKNLMCQKFGTRGVKNSLKLCNIKLKLFEMEWRTNTSMITWHLILRDGRGGLGMTQSSSIYLFSFPRRAVCLGCLDNDPKMESQC